MLYKKLSSYSSLDTSNLLDKIVFNHFTPVYISVYELDYDTQETITFFKNEMVIVSC